MESGMGRKVVAKSGKHRSEAETGDLDEIELEKHEDTFRTASNTLVSNRMRLLTLQAA